MMMSHDRVLATCHIVPLHTCEPGCSPIAYLSTQCMKNNWEHN
jgi:hypothetical protein